RGGIAMRLIEFAKVLGGRLPGALAHCNVLANMMFGSISGSAVASAAAVGGVMAPLQKKEGYDPAFSAAVNIASCPTGLLIPPSATFIVYSLITNGTSVAALFVAGYVPGILMGLSLMLVAGFIAKRRGYPVAERPSRKEVLDKSLAAMLPLGLIVIVMGGIIGGVFTATEASAVAVVYTLFLALVVYREVTWRHLPGIILESAVTTSIVLLMIGCSIAMSKAMAFADIPYSISDILLGLSENPIVLLLIINLALLVVGTFMDMTPALLIFTPIFLPVVEDLGMDPVHFGVVMTFNLCIGICTPPVGSALFVGCSVAGVKIGEVIRPMLGFYAVLVALLLVVTYVPELSLFLPRVLLGY
ncbi:MAG: TRAP transporter large permease, partial [Roseibium sp.]